MVVDIGFLFVRITVYGGNLLPQAFIHHHTLHLLSVRVIVCLLHSLSSFTVITVIILAQLPKLILAVPQDAGLINLSSKQAHMLILLTF